MKIQIIGVGRFGSQIAFNCLALLRPKEVWLDDIKNLRGDILDLRHSARALKLDTRIEEGIEKTPDYVIIAAGESRDENNRSMKKLFDSNKVLLEDIIKNKTSTKHRAKVIVTTNPVIGLTEWAKEKFSDRHDFYHAEDILMRYRNGKDCGWEIVKTKGYSNFGPALAVIELIRRLEEGKR
jgi:malate/lactate dehydrogenase